MIKMNRKMMEAKQFCQLDIFYTTFKNWKNMQIKTIVFCWISGCRRATGTRPSQIFYSSSNDTFYVIKIHLFFFFISTITIASLDLVCLIKFHTKQPGPCLWTARTVKIMKNQMTIRTINIILNRVDYFVAKQVAT